MKDKIRIITEIDSYILETIEILKKSGHNPIAVCPSMFDEVVYIFNTPEESDVAYNEFEKEKKQILGWWSDVKGFDEGIDWYNKNVVDVNYIFPVYVIDEIFLNQTLK